MREIFRRFGAAGAGSSNQAAISVLRAWQTVLGTDGDGPLLLERLALVQRAVSRLLEQASNAKLLDKESRDVALNVIRGLSHCINPDIFPSAIHQHSSNFSADRLGTLGMLANSLRLEFPEAELETDQLAELKSDLDKLIEAIRQAPLPRESKETLLRHATYMAWAMRNIDIAGLENVYDAIGKAMIATARLPEGDTDSDTPTVRDRAMTFFKNVSRFFVAAERAEEGVQAIEHLYRDVSGLIG